MIKRLLALTNCLLLLVLVYVFYLVYFPIRVIDFKDKVFPVITHEIERGDSVEYVSSYCKYSDVESHVTRAFVNDFIYTTATFTTKRSKGCESKVVVVPIPSELPPGEYYLNNKYEYQVNLLRKITVTHNTEKFIIK